jgi:hypothetical protein
MPSAAGTTEEVSFLKVTIDSSEPLADALRVLGALYDVTLVVSPSQPGPTGAGEAEAPAQAPRVSRKQPPRAAAKDRALRAPTVRGGRARKSAAPVETAQLRTWARDNGYTVSDRGRVAASVLQAYEAAHQA